MLVDSHAHSTQRHDLPWHLPNIPRCHICSARLVLSVRLKKLSQVSRIGSRPPRARRVGGNPC